MKLSDLKKLVAILEANADGKDTEIMFSDFSRRSFPVLDFDRPVDKFIYANHVRCDDSGVVQLPLDTPVGGG